MGKLVIIPALPGNSRHQRKSGPDLRYVEGQRLLVEAIKYLVKTGRARNRAAVELLSEHVRTRFRMSDSPRATEQ